jgi:hypothetical protein
MVRLARGGGGASNARGKIFSCGTFANALAWHSRACAWICRTPCRRLQPSESRSAAARESTCRQPPPTRLSAAQTTRSSAQGICRQSPTPRQLLNELIPCCAHALIRVLDTRNERYVRMHRYRARFIFAVQAQLCLALILRSCPAQTVPDRHRFNYV